MTRITALDRSNCPVAVSLNLFGDKWTLLIVRDLFIGKRRYSEFLESPEAVPTNILADRLKRLLAEGVIEKTAYSDKPKRYEYALTEKGRALGPVLQEFVKWANAHYPKTYRLGARDGKNATKLKAIKRR